MFAVPIRDALSRVLTLIGLGVSVLLLAEYLAPSHAVCSPGGGCDEIRLSSYAEILSLPTPAYGVFFFTVAFLLTMIRHPKIRQAMALWSVIGAGVALALIYIQVDVLDAVCIYCAVVDAAVLLLAVVALTLHRAEPPDTSGFEWVIYGGLAALVVAGGAVLPGVLKRPAPSVEQLAELPEPIAREQRDDMLMIVEFVDLQCPACRAQHRQLLHVLPKYEDRVDIVYKHLPLPQHPDALGAAAAVVCSGEHEKKMAHHLFTTPRPTRDVAEDKAEELGLDLEEFRACLESENTAAVLANDLEDAEAVGVRALPTVFIGKHKYTGVRMAEEVEEIIEDELDARGD